MVCSGLHIMEFLAQAVLVNCVYNAQPSQGIRWYFITRARGDDIKSFKGIQQLHAAQNLLLLLKLSQTNAAAP